MSFKLFRDLYTSLYQDIILGRVFSAWVSISFIFDLEFDAICTDSLFVVYFNKSALDSRSLSSGNNRPYNIKFYGQKSNGSCSTNGTSTTDIDIHSTAPVPGSLTNGTVYIGTNLTENMCGINIIPSAENIIYNATIVVTYGQNPSSIILREEYDYYNVMCLMNRTVEQQLEGSKVDVLYRAPGKGSQSKSIFSRYF